MLLFISLKNFFVWICLMYIILAWKSQFSSLTAPSTGIISLCDHTWAVFFLIWSDDNHDCLLPLPPIVVFISLLLMVLFVCCFPF